MYSQQPDQKGILDQFKGSLQALAVPASDQLSLFPDFVCKADELALDFDHWYNVAESHIKFTPEQTQVLAELDERLSEMSRNGSLFSEELWTEKGLETSEHWGRVRTLAQTALSEFGWTIEHPPEGRSTYVPG